MHPIDESSSYALAKVEERQRRLKLLEQPHIKPLIEYLQIIQIEMGAEYAMPYFDPCDGGIEANVLFLLEAPGPKAVGSGFISRNNPDQTAKNMNELLQEAQIPRRNTLLWNIVPWYVGDQGRIRPVNKQDIRQALPFLQRLLQLLPHLEAVVLVGRKAQNALVEIQKLAPDISIYQCYHPSPRVFNVWPEKRNAVLHIFEQIASKLQENKR
jgi:uracil-DNA glycosylase